MKKTKCTRIMHIIWNKTNAQYSIRTITQVMRLGRALLLICLVLSWPSLRRLQRESTKTDWPSKWLRGMSSQIQQTRKWNLPVMALRFEHISSRWRRSGLNISRPRLASRRQDTRVAYVMELELSKKLDSARQGTFYVKNEVDMIIWYHFKKK